MIEKYFLQLERILHEFPDVRSISLKKKIYNNRLGYIAGSVTFENGYRLDFVEVRNADMKPKEKQPCRKSNWL